MSSFGIEKVDGIKETIIFEKKVNEAQDKVFTIIFDELSELGSDTPLDKQKIESLIKKYYTQEYIDARNQLNGKIKRIFIHFVKGTYTGLQNSTLSIAFSNEILTNLVGSAALAIVQELYSDLKENHSEMLDEYLKPA